MPSGPSTLLRVASVLLSTLLCTSLANAQDAAAGNSPDATAHKDGRLVAVELAVPLCLRHHPEQGRLLQTAWSEWSAAHAPELKAYRERLAANPREVADAREKLGGVLQTAVTGTQGAEFCANAAEIVRGLGGPLDPGVAAGMYHQKMLRADALEAACARLHPSISKDIRRDRRKWEADDAPFQKLSREHMAALAGQPGSGIPAMATESKRVWTAVVEEAEARGEAVAFCRDAFADLAAGKMRRTSPDVYEALSRALGTN